MSTQTDSDGDSTGSGALPTGTVTFVVGDLAGSTWLWKDRPKEMAAVLARMDELIEAARSAHDGRRPPGQGESDNFVFAFAGASGALAFAADLQARICAQTWPGGISVGLRMAVHTGEARVRDGNRYMGEVLNRCGRLRTLGHPGQVLVSGATAVLVADALPSGLTLRDLGTHQLRDLSRSERVAQLCGPDLPADFPGLRCLDLTPTNLPAQATSFVGRAAEIAETSLLLGDRRLLSLLGAGGCGKTRLAVALASQVAADFPDGVWFADLAPLSDPDLIARTVAVAAGISEVPRRALLEVLTERLAPTKTLVVLDNCEHLVDSAAAVADALVRGCPGVRVLVTSREPLAAPGETTYRVPSLGLPAGPDDTGCESVRLFADRVTLARPTMQVGPAEVADMSAICSRLDGIPLAIELAAAHCGALTLRQISMRLASHFGLLTGGTRGALPRHRALEASIAWSYDLLADEGQRLLCRLSVFAGGFDLEAAEAVAVSTREERGSVVDALIGLVDRSLVQLGDDGRYRLLEPVRQFAEARLPAVEAAAVRARHAEHYRLVAAAAADDLYGTAITATRARLAQDRDNLRTAVEYAIARGDADLAWDLVLPIDVFWHSSLAEATDRLSRVLALPGLAPDRRLLGLAASAEHACHLGDLAALARWTSEGLAMLDADTSPLARGWLVELGGWSRLFRDEDGTVEQGRAGVELLRQDGSPRARYYMLDGLWGVGLAELAAGRTTEALAVFDEALALARAAGGLIGLGRSRFVAAMCGLIRGDLHGLHEEFAASVAMLEECGDDMGLIAAVLAATAAALGGDAAARPRLRATVEQARAMRQGFAIALGAWGLTVIEARTPGGPDWRVAVGESEPMLARVGFRWAEAWVKAARAVNLLAENDLAGADAAVRDALETVAASPRAELARGPVELARARVDLAAGNLVTAEDAVHRALAALTASNLDLQTVEALELLAELAIAAPDASKHFGAEAARLLSGTTAARDALGFPRTAAEEQRVAGLREQLTGATEVLEAESADGSRMSLPDLVAYASRRRGARRRPASGWEALTPTERSVVNLIARGLRNPEIATELFVSTETVKTHVSSALAKLGVSNRTELAALAIRRG
jgi:predicted ATPase/DNA-binding NarL/FixJ family response regulator